MLEVFHTPSNNPFVTTFVGGSTSAGTGWVTWLKPRGKSMLNIFLVGSGGSGGTGVTGANSVSAGGGGGGSGSQAMLTIPLALLPDVLYLCLPGQAAASASVSYIAIQPTTTVNSNLLTAKGGTVGGNAAAGTGGAAGAAGVITAIADCPLAAAGNYNFLVGQAGIIGGAAVAGAALTLPVTGLRVTGGTGGGGLPAAAATGTNGGSFTVPAAPSIFPPHVGGVGSATATAPANWGRNGFNGVAGLFYSYGGTGGASTHGTATGGGLVKSNGGDGGYGSGGGGMGGGLTGSSGGAIGKGGPAVAILSCW